MRFWPTLRGHNPGPFWSEILNLPRGVVKHAGYQRKKQILALKIKLGV